MKRIFSIFLSIIFILALPSCDRKDESSQWEFYYSIEKGVFLQGEMISITVEVTNIGRDYKFIGAIEDLFGAAELYLKSDETQILSTLPFVNTDDATERVFQKGEKASRTYEFFTDEKSPEGIYVLKVPFGGEYKVFGSVLAVKAPPTEEELAIIELADAFMATEYPAVSLDDCRVDIRQSTDGEYSVEYTITICGYRTWESYTVYFNADKTVKRTYASQEGKYSAYLPYATAERISEAEEILKKQVKQYDTQSAFYLQVDDEGYLCLLTEIIVDLPLGDHEHKFFEERICGLQ